MAIVVETLNRLGRVLNSEFFDKTTISIGRAFDSDYVVDDHFVDADHMTVHSDEDGSFLCVDNNSINGIRNQKRQVMVSPYRVEAGDKIVIGKTLLRIATSRTIVKPAMKMSFIESLGERLASLPIAIMSMICLLSLAVYDIYISAFTVSEETYVSVIYLLLASLFASTLLALLGKILRHDNRFLLYFTLINSVLILSYLYSLISPIVFFNLNFVTATSTINELFYVLLFAVFVYLGLRFSTRLRLKALAVLASIVPALMMVDIFIPDLDSKPFRYIPPYSNLVIHNSFYWQSKQSHEQFQRSVERLYQVTIDE